MAYGSRWFQHNAVNAPKVQDGQTVEPAPQDAPVDGGEVSLSELIRSSQQAAEAAQAAQVPQPEVAQADVPLPRVSEEEVPAQVENDHHETSAQPEPAPAPKNLELSALVRQWMATRTDLRTGGGQDGDVLHLVPTTSDEGGSEVSDPPDDDVPEDSRTALPRRRKEVPRPTPARRMGVLIDAHTTLPESLDGLFDALVDEGTVSVSRAYGDWSPMGAQTWMSQLRHHAIQPVHHFPTEHDQRSMVAMTIDAVDLARDSAVDVLVLVGDLTSGHPLLQRLNACGVPVLAFGPTDTPYDVRALCEEFVDLGFLDARESAGAGRHRA